MDLIYKGKDYSYLQDTYVEIERSDHDYNIGEHALVTDVRNDCLRVSLDNGEVFWTDVDSVYHE